jgi:hypothetical protein
MVIYDGGNMLVFSLRTARNKFVQENMGI